jgi:hypothetical protein
VPAGTIQLWQYTDARGTVVVVDALEKVPPALRAQAHEVVLSQRPAGVVGPAAGVLEAGVHWPSFGAGLVLALLVVVVAKVVWSGAKLVLKIAAVVVVVAALAGGYFGVIREQAGLGSGAASPKDLLDDAQRAADQAKKMIDKQQRELRKSEDK